MALASFATPADLSGLLGIAAFTGAKLTQAQMWLDAASAEIRAVVGQDITRQTTTAILPGVEDYWLDLPQWPVVSVASVVMNGQAVTDYKLIGNRLYRWWGWQDLFIIYEPRDVTVTYTSGRSVPPADLVTLCASLASVGMAQAASGTLGTTPGIGSEAIDDYKVVFNPSGSANPIAIPDATAARLRAKYGNGGAVAVRA